MAARLTGIVPPLVTPLHADGTPDLEALDALVDAQLDAGVHGLFVLGSTGEVAYLTDAQREAGVARVVERTAGRVPVVAGAIDLSTARVIEQARRMAGAGATHVVVTAPFYAINSPTEIGDHFRAVRAAVDVPVVAYDVPVRVHAKLGVPLLMELAAEGVIDAVKDSSGDDVSFRRLILANRAAGSPLALLSGHEIVLDGMFLMGADGAVPGLANVVPEAYVALWDAAQAGDWAEARRQQEHITAVFDIVFQAPGRSGDAAGVGAFKAAMAELGQIPGATMAHPVRALDGEALAGVRRVVAAVLGRPA